MISPLIPCKEVLHDIHKGPAGFLGTGTTGSYRQKASAVIETILEIMKSTLANAEDLLISGFGKFSIKSKNERKGRNPATGTPMPLRSRRVVVFRCSPVLKGN
ncbi:MAG: integration host factor subunit alpha [Desulfobacteraceae bacterium]|nr:MAG: integration host factor subunit alpha [Desulfobacteraceae bacterium]